MSQDHRIILTAQQLRRLPGRGSKLSALRLRGMIEGLLVEAGIDTRAWATKGGRDILAFEVVDRSGGGDIKVFHFRFEVPKIYVKQKKGPKYLESTSWRFFHDYMEHRLYAVILGFDSIQKSGNKYLESTSWRFFHDYMEHRLYAVILGFDSIVEEFTDHMVMLLPDGREQTVSERITEAITKGEQEALPFIRRDA